MSKTKTSGLYEIGQTTGQQVVRSMNQRRFFAALKELAIYLVVGLVLITLVLTLIPFPSSLVALIFLLLCAVVGLYAYIANHQVHNKDHLRKRMLLVQETLVADYGNVAWLIVPNGAGIKTDFYDMDSHELTFGTTVHTDFEEKWVDVVVKVKWRRSDANIYEKYQYRDNGEEIIKNEVTRRLAAWSRHFKQEEAIHKVLGGRYSDIFEKDGFIAEFVEVVRAVPVEDEILTEAKDD
jgi:Ca2+/Na+ antiporter